MSRLDGLDQDVSDRKDMYTVIIVGREGMIDGRDYSYRPVQPVFEVGLFHE